MLLSGKGANEGTDISSTNLIRLGGLAVMVGGVVYAGVAMMEGRLAEYLYYMGNIG